MVCKYHDIRIDQEIFCNQLISKKQILIQSTKYTSFKKQKQHKNLKSCFLFFYTIHKQEDESQYLLTIKTQVTRSIISWKWTETPALSRFWWLVELWISSETLLSLICKFKTNTNIKNWKTKNQASKSTYTGSPLKKIETTQLAYRKFIPFRNCWT